MALIKCPECGREVSDRAGSCPHCGFPLTSLKTDGTVMIKLNVKNVIGQTNIFETSTGKSLWLGNHGTVASFHIDKPTEISIGWGFAKNKVQKELTATVEAGKKYELVAVEGFLGFKYSIRCVDMIDSE